MAHTIVRRFILRRCSRTMPSSSTSTTITETLSCPPSASASARRLSAAPWGVTLDTATASMCASEIMDESPSEQMMMRSPASTSIVKWSAYMLGSEPSARVIMERLGCRRASPTVISPASTSSST